jgi:hypothetical protein
MFCPLLPRRSQFSAKAERSPLLLMASLNSLVLLIDKLAVIPERAKSNPQLYQSIVLSRSGQLLKLADAVYSIERRPLSKGLACFIDECSWNFAPFWLRVLHLFGRHVGLTISAEERRNFDKTVLQYGKPLVACRLRKLCEERIICIGSQMQTDLKRRWGLVWNLDKKQFRISSPLKG